MMLSPGATSASAAVRVENVLTALPSRVAEPTQMTWTKLHGYWSSVDPSLPDAATTTTPAA